MNPVARFYEKLNALFGTKHFAYQRALGKRREQIRVQRHEEWVSLVSILRFLERFSAMVSRKITFWDQVARGPTGEVKPSSEYRPTVQPNAPAL
jgi:hypothetical protein